MLSIKVNQLAKSYEYYKKDLGLANSIKNLFHREKLIKNAVDGISFEINEGEVVAFLGPNGAGKTTTLKMISGILFPTSGTATVMGYVPWERKKNFKKQLSIVLGQKNQLMWDLPAIESIYMNKCIYDVDTQEYNVFLEELTELLDVKQLLKVQVRRLSLGERMKMELIAALIHKPKVIFLDEPTIGLDIVSQVKIREFISYYNQQYNATIILTSHYMKDVENLCKRAIIINHGEIVYDDDLNKVNKLLGDKKVIKIPLSDNIDEGVIQGIGNPYKQDGSHIVMEVEKKDLKHISQELFDRFPSIDMNIEDIPIEDGIAQIYLAKRNDG
ncbi:ATP-binding cassette domain-containing protein [Paenibacillus polysaccharolyticus]|uniref:ABC transporter ATP-binding protein n=1 Tax=Paenibacillus polysaccharolyticus TaxID=582692 RepID=UPI00203CD065|nr:ATP-binding cassette domain-containing protein [Paenibacillus polysaccharolyticus]MCM3132891.1 ATP-binding cassette domain-containing protein [Paenibacillus polysaccharolyticus]